MSKSVLAALAFIVGAAVAAPAAYFFSRLDTEAEIASLKRERETLQKRVQTAEADSQNANTELARLRAAAAKNKGMDTEIAADHDRLAREKGEAEDRARKAEEALSSSKQDALEKERAKNAEIDRLRGILEKHGIWEHLTQEEITVRMKDGEERFRRAFESKDKGALMKALADLQRLGPTAYDKVIELWKLAAEDYGVGENWGKGPNTLGLNFQEYVSLITNFDIVKYGVTAANVDESFKINSLYGLPWWTNEPTAQRAKLAGDALFNSSGYTSIAAIEALSSIPDPASIRYLSDYLSKNADNAEARKQAINALAQKNTPEAWAAIDKAAASDADEGVRQAAKQAQMIRDPKATGLMITWVDPNGQGALAGIKIGDIMTHYNGRAIKSIADVGEAKKTVADGESAPVRLVRGSETIDVTLAPGTIGINGRAVTAK